MKAIAKNWINTCRNGETLVYCLMSAMSLTLLVVLYQHELKKVEEHKVLELKTQTSSAKAVAQNTLNWRFNDIYYLRQTFHQLEEYSTVDDFAPRLAKIWIDFVQSREIYFQARWIDFKGQEKMRIDKRHEGFERLAFNSLQDKSHRDYFIEGTKLPINQAFISAYDLNVEHGKVSIPHQPTLRIGVRVDYNRGKDAGILLLNYDANDFIGRIKKVQPTIWLTNNRGYWLYNPSEEKICGHSLGQKELTLAHQYPEEWNKIQHSVEGYFASKNGIWVFNTAFTPDEQGVIHEHNLMGSIHTLKQTDYPWKLIARISANELSIIKQPIHQRYIALLAVSSMLVIAIGFLLKRSKNNTAKMHKEALAREFAEQAKQELEEKIAERTAELKAANRQLENLANIDPLTEIANRRALNERLTFEFARMQRTQQCFALLQIDIDHFKQINDRFGHPTGDKVLQFIATTLANKIRSTDFVARVGGEEFVILLPNTNKGTQTIAKKICLAIAYSAPPTVSQVTVSIGASIATLEDENCETALYKADEALYQAKQNGRNQVCMAQA